jgi:hypothetical protein
MSQGSFWKIHLKLNVFLKMCVVPRMAVFTSYYYCHCYYYFDVLVTTRQTKVFSTSAVSSALRHSPSPRCIIAANDICRFLDILSKYNVSFDDTLDTGKCLDWLVRLVICV